MGPTHLEGHSLLRVMIWETLYTRLAHWNVNAVDDVCRMGVAHISVHLMTYGCSSYKCTLNDICRMGVAHISVHLMTYGCGSYKCTLNDICCMGVARISVHLMTYAVWVWLIIVYT